MRGLRSTSFILSTFVALGCSKTSPTFGVLDQTAIPQPTFAGQTTLTVNTAGLGVTTPVQGECDARIRAIDARVIGGTAGALAAIATATPTVDCGGTGKFSFTLNTLNALLASPQANQTYRIELRAETAGGISNPSVISVTFVKELPEATRVTSGGSESGTTPRGLASSSYRADVRITHLVNAADATTNPKQTSATSTSYQLRYGRAEQATN